MKMKFYDLNSKTKLYKDDNNNNNNNDKVL